MSKGAALLWVENYSENFSYKNYTVVALSPEASHALRSADIAHSFLENYGPKFSDFEDLYFEEVLSQLELLDKLLDRFLAPLGFSGLGLFRNHWLRVKTLFDSLIILSRRMAGCVRTAGAERIEYLGVPSALQKSFSLTALNDNNRRFLRPVARIVAEHMNVSFKEYGVQRGNVSETAAEAGTAPTRILKNSKKILKSAYFFWKYGKTPPFFSAIRPAKDMRVLFTAMGSSDMDPAAKSLIRQGASVFLREGSFVNEVSPLVHKRAFDLGGVWDAAQMERLKEGLDAAATALEGETAFFEWFKGYAGCDLRKILMPYLRDFVKVRCFEALREYAGFKKFMTDFQINMLIVRESTQYINTMALLAAGNLGGVRRVCFQHGGFVSDSKIWRLSQTDLMDFYYAWGPESREYTAAEVASGPRPACRVFEYSHFFPASPVKRAKNRTETIFYLPTKAVTGTERLNMLVYPATWYFNFQLAILDYLNTLKNKRVVFKSPGEGRGWLKSETFKYVKESLSNIEIATEPFTKCLCRADKVLMDIPSTAIYQAAAAGMPVMALYPEKAKIRESCKRYFGASLQSFTDFEDAVEKIKAFVHSSGDRYRFEHGLTDHPRAADALPELLNGKERPR